MPSKAFYTLLTVKVPKLRIFVPFENRLQTDHWKKNEFSERIYSKLIDYNPTLIHSNST